MNKPNLVYIFADQLRFQSLGYNGDKFAITPNIDKIAGECMVMENAVSGHPVCAPYRASLFTGKYTTSTGMVINEIRINPNHKTFANVLNEGGYETGYIGKWHLYAARLGHHYDTENSFIPDGDNRLGFNNLFAAYNFHHEYYSPKAYYHLNSPEKLYYDKYEPDAQTDMAIEAIRGYQKSNKPFALFLSYGTPHDPWTKENVPEEYYNKFRDVDFPEAPNFESANDRHADMWARFNIGERKKLNEWKRVYYAMVNNLDDNIGRLYNELETSGLLENTVFVFTSDHGEMFGAHGRRAKNIFYDEAARVPFLIKCGDKIEAGINDNCFNTVDIMPTLLSMMKLPVPESVEGIDISESILNGKHIDNDCLMMGTGPTSLYGNGKEWRAIRSKRFTYAVYKIDGKEFLFDNINDPYQMNNLYYNKDYSEIYKALKAEMYLKMKKIGDTFEKNSFYKKYWVKDRIINADLPRRDETQKIK